MAETFKVGLLGHGTVGSAFALVSRFVFTSGKWNERKTLPGATRVVTRAHVWPSMTPIPTARSAFS